MLSLTLLLLAATAAPAEAAVCAKGVYRAGCAGPRGATDAWPYGHYGAHPYTRAIARPYRYGAYCRWRTRLPRSTSTRPRPAAPSLEGTSLLGGVSRFLVLSGARES
jgi:hypothetical protein